MHIPMLNPAATVERRSACSAQAATAPDVALAQRMLGHLFSDQPPARPVSNLGLTGAQEMFKLRGLPPQFQVNHMTADGRFTLLAWSSCSSLAHRSGPPRSGWRRITPRCGLTWPR